MYFSDFYIPSLNLIIEIRMNAFKNGFSLIEGAFIIGIGDKENKKAFFESDGKGIPVGNSYSYMTIDDMLRIGYLYLQNGQWNGEQILSPQWVAQTQQITDGLQHLDEIKKLGTTLDGKKNEYEIFKQEVLDEGVYGQRGFWLNKTVKGIREPREFPNSPEDMYFAAGHFGQLIFVIPSKDMVIVHTGGNKEYWSRIDRIVQKSIACFSDKSWGF
jgi:CubicO group peptidase (beta-lactamase class C family)